MKQFKFFCTALIAAACAIGFTACGGDENNGGDDPVIPDLPDTPSGPQASDAKDYIDEVGQAYLNMFNPNDQKVLIDFVQNFKERYGNLEAPAEWDLDDEDDYYFNISRVFKFLGEGVKHNDPVAMTRAMSNTYDFARYAGVYEPGGDDRWVKTGSSKDIVFKFLINGQHCEFKAERDGGEWSTTDFDSEVDVKIPQTVKVNVIQGGTSLANGTIYTNPDKKGHKIDAEITMTAANLSANGRINGTDSKLSGHSTLSVNGSVVTTVDLNINGSDLCNYNKIQSNPDNFISFLRDGNFSANVLNRIEVRGTVKNFTDIFRATYDDFSNEEYDSTTAAIMACDKACETLNNNINANLYLGSDDVWGKLAFITDGEDYNYYFYYQPTPAIRFSDGTTYGFGEYFGEGFSTLESMYHNLVASYVNLWR